MALVTLQISRWISASLSLSLVPVDLVIESAIPGKKSNFSASLGCPKTY